MDGEIKHTENWQAENKEEEPYQETDRVRKNENDRRKKTGGRRHTCDNYDKKKWKKQRRQGDVTLKTNVGKVAGSDIWKQDMRNRGAMMKE